MQPPPLGFEAAKSNSVAIVLNSNRTRRATWNSRLGPRRCPFSINIHSVRPDGGVIGALDVLIEVRYTRTHP